MVYGDNYSSRGPSYKWGGSTLYPSFFFAVCYGKWSIYRWSTYYHLLKWWCSRALVNYQARYRSQVSPNLFQVLGCRWNNDRTLFSRTLESWFRYREIIPTWPYYSSFVKHYDLPTYIYIYYLFIYLYIYPYIYIIFTTKVWSIESIHGIGLDRL